VNHGKTWHVILMIPLWVSLLQVVSLQTLTTYFIPNGEDFNLKVC